MPKLVDYSTQDGIAILELNAPPANAYGYQMMRDLDEAILEARMDENVHCLVLRGKGDKFFCGVSPAVTSRSRALPGQDALRGGVTECRGGERTARCVTRFA